VIHLFCALRCEARTIIDFYRLKRLNQAELFPIYEDKQKTVSLTVTGTGKTAAASAVMYTGLLLEIGKTGICINTGIAGHADMPQGRAVLANKITDFAAGRTWYPQILTDPGCPATELITLDRPSYAYQVRALFDMEASGFYEASTRFTTAEFCHCLKVVSDNRFSDIKRITADFVTGIISANLSQLDSLISRLSLLVPAFPEPGEPALYEQMIATWRFSQSERIRLKKLLRRWDILLPGSPVPVADLVKKYRNGSQVLAGLQTRLDRTPVSLQRVSGS